MSDSPTMKTKIHINRIPSEELITDAQSAINSGMNSFEQGNYADMSMLRDDPELAQNPLNFINQGQQQQPQDMSFVAQEQEAPLQQQPVQQQQVQPKQETNKEYNIRIMRERAEVAEARAKYLENMMSSSQSQYEQPPFQQQYQQKPHVRNEPQQDDSFNIDMGDEELIEVKHLKKYLGQVKQEFKREQQRANQQIETNIAENRMKLQYSDFDRVVNPETIKDFAKIYPEEFSSMDANPNPYAALKTAYTLIKNSGLVDENSNQQSQRMNYADQDRRIQENLKKPRTAARMGTQPDGSTLGKLNDYGRRILTESEKQKVRERLEHSRRFSSY